MFRTNFAAESADIDANAPLMVVGDNGKWGVIIFGVFILGNWNFSKIACIQCKKEPFLVLKSTHQCHTRTLP